VKKYHPDVSANTEYIKILNEAYSVLCDEEARKKYNEEKGLNIVKQPEMQENRMQEPRQ
jgi:curved DNA-binding protein CbpA